MDAHLFDSIADELEALVSEWETKLMALPEELISDNRNSQDRSIRQIVGHMNDSASNNTHRIILLQYEEIPLLYPDYANNGNNDRWIAIQNYQGEAWPVLVNAWKYNNLHIAHVFRNIDAKTLHNVWVSALNEEISLNTMVQSYLNHFKLHIHEIEELMK